jgi:hypothetical protein
LIFPFVVRAERFCTGWRSSGWMIWYFARPLSVRSVAWRMKRPSCPAFGFGAVCHRMSRLFA